MTVAIYVLEGVRCVLYEVALRKISQVRYAMQGKESTCSAQHIPMPFWLHCLIFLPQYTCFKTCKSPFHILSVHATKNLMLEVKL